MLLPREVLRCPIVIVPAILLVVFVGWPILVFTTKLQQGISIQNALRSRITPNTHVSGFYGPGAWWGFLLTLGMTHGHAGMAVLKTGRISPEWDYDLTSAAFYAVVAAIDLIFTSRALSRLGDAASQSTLIPSLVCAERVVSLGTGSFLFASAFSLVYGSSFKHRLRLLCIAAIPLTFALVASIFSFHAHQVMSHSAPVIWCPLHDSSNHAAPFTMVDYPAYIGQLLFALRAMLTSQIYWLAAGITSGIITFAALVFGAFASKILTSVSYAFVGTLGFFIAFPIACVSLMACFNMVQWLLFWVFFWWPIYLLAFFPQLDYFPRTNISISELDQLAALVAVSIVATIRTWLRVFGRQGEASNE
ncbi:hypothetical protein R3P38DRAFT_3048343 [Favolaschia claudopus]|uniref:Uncharacterized protein n=1 Tax=Favolaschia claudopus TaxID=2862362 RepID=A0AAW0A512_9AGAR